MPSDDLRRIAVELAAELSDETADAICPVLTEAADENEALRFENESWRSLDQIRLDLLRQSGAELRRLQALIDAYAKADAEDDISGYSLAHQALLAAATKDDDRG